MKAAIIGGGNIGLALAEGLIRAKVCKPPDVIVTRQGLSSALIKGIKLSSNIANNLYRQS